MGIRDDLLRAVKKGEVALIVLANFLKLFQTVRYKNRLITKALFHFFFKTFLRWSTSYLSNRSHFVQIDDQMSNQGSVHFVVPQRSILGPMLFELCVSDLQDSLPNSVTTVTKHFCRPIIRSTVKTKSQMKNAFITY